MAIRKQGFEVGNIARILKELVQTKKLTSSVVESLLQGLADRKDFLLGISNPTWEDLKTNVPDSR